MIRVKICSIQELAHALAVAEAGADFVGLNFVPGVRRRLPEEKAKRMVQAYRKQRGRNGPKLVGIFADQPIEEVNRILDACDLDMAQLSGRELLYYCARVERRVIKVVHVPMNKPVDLVVSTLDPLLGELEAADTLPLLDPEVAEGHGGTGVAFDWAIARALATRHKFLMGGGLIPENVGQAVRAVRPWGVDVSSGVETGGVKDAKKIRAFVAMARAPVVHQRDQ